MAMGNPIFDFFQNQQQPTQPVEQGGILGLINQVRNSQNPEAFMQNLASTNPQIKNIMDYVNQNGGDARAAFYNLAAQKGVDPNSILNQLR